MRRFLIAFIIAGSLLQPVRAFAAEHEIVSAGPESPAAAESRVEPAPATAAEPEPAAPAAEPPHSPAPICDAAESEDYITKTSGQFLRGAVNLGFCWVELFNQPVVAYREGHSVPFGFVKGVGCMILRGGKGLGEFLLCWDPRDPKNDSFPKPLSNDCAFGILGLEDR